MLNTQENSMSALKSALLVAAATIALASPVLAQNFHGFGASSYADQQDNAPTQSKPAKLKTAR